MFRALSVFVGGFSLEAVEALGGGPEAAIDLLGSLVDQSLVSVGADGPTRYRMFEPVRHYALKKLEESEEEGTIRARHAAYSLALAERARQELHGPNQAQWLDDLDREHGNTSAAIAWLLDRGEAEKVVQIGWGAYDFWFRRGYTGEGLRWMERVLDGGDGLSLLPEHGLCGRSRSSYSHGTSWTERPRSLQRASRRRGRCAIPKPSLTRFRSRGSRR